MKDFAKSIRTGNASFDEDAEKENKFIKKYFTHYHGRVDELEKILQAAKREGISPDFYSSWERMISEAKQKGKKTVNSKVVNSNKAEIIEKKKKEGATLKVDNGQKLEFSDGSTYVKTTGSEDYREAHNYVGNADPRIASLKSKIKQNKDDIGALKDVYYFADDMVKQLTERKQKLLNDVHEIEKDLDGYISLRSEVKFMI